MRVPLIFLFLAVSVFSGHPVPESWFIVAFTAMLLSAATDLLDGYFARRFEVTSRLGSYADPMMDKVFYLTTFPTVVYLADRIGQHRHARILLVLAILFLLRDQWVSFLRSWARSTISAPRPTGQARPGPSSPSRPSASSTIISRPRPPGLFGCPPGRSMRSKGLSVAINVVSIGVYTACFWPALRAELRLPGDGRDTGE